MLRVLDSRRWGRTVASLTSWLRRGPARRQRAARATILAVAPALIRECFAGAERAAAKIRPGSPPAAYHRLRIRCKALRYALEFHRELYGDPARRLLRVLARLQDLLGEHQDAEVAARRLRELVQQEGRRLPAPAAFLAGTLAERQRRRARSCRRSWPGSWARLGRRWRRLEHAMAAAAAVEGGTDGL